MSLNCPWIDNFIRQNKRPPRILHIGNIAGNAFQNAKMLNAAGADCDVLCADYYHIMGSPEWDEANFSGQIKNPNYPAWHKLNLHGYARPQWFIQAPRRIAIAYLLAKRSGNKKAAQKLWNMAENIRKYYSFRQESPLKNILLWMEKLAFSLMAFARRIKNPGAAKAPDAKNAQNPAQNPLLQRLNRDAKQLFPLLCMDFDGQWQTDYRPEEAALYAPLFNCYDLVQGYATDCIWPYLAGFENYTAYEHGTLRALPVQKTTTAHLAMLAFARAKAITVTNVDCLDDAKIIAKPLNTPIVCGLHGIDMEKMLKNIDEQKPSLCAQDRFDVPQDIPVFFCPSRHTFLKEQQTFIKGEEKAICAAARLAKNGGNFRLVLAHWGDDVNKIKALVSSFKELDGKVIWTPPLAKAQFYRALLCANAVLDQFYLKVYGGITFEVLCASHAVLISSPAAKDDYAKLFYGKLLPYYSCSTEDEIFNAMEMVLKKPKQAAALAAQGKKWILDCHSSQRIVEKCCQAFSHCNLPQKSGMLI